MKFILLITLFGLVYFVDAKSSLMNYAKFLACAKLDIGSCQFKKLNDNYILMNTANCLKCDKYFHCKGNYEAVYSCSNGSLADRKKIAKKLSDCRETAQNSSSKDKREDLKANEFGRNKGDCAKQYLCSYGCKYNPKNKTCKKTNC